MCKGSVTLCYYLASACPDEASVCCGKATLGHYLISLCGCKASVCQDEATVCKERVTLGYCLASACGFKFCHSDGGRNRCFKILIQCFLRQYDNKTLIKTLLYGVIGLAFGLVV